MPKTRTISRRVEDPPKPAVEVVRDAADALFRAALECCHQHDRVSRVLAKSALEDEIAAAQRGCEMCAESLQEIVSHYEGVAAAVHPTGADEEWWHRANALWMASREYLRRHDCCDSATLGLTRHRPEDLGALHAEYELEGSSLLALRQAAESYRTDRPEAA